MPDPVDRTQQDEEWLFKSALSKERPEPRGGYRCATPGCAVRDDRIMAGYKFCEPCMEERRESGNG